MYQLRVKSVDEIFSSRKRVLFFLFPPLCFVFLGGENNTSHDDKMTMMKKVEKERGEKMIHFGCLFWSPPLLLPLLYHCVGH